MRIPHRLWAPAAAMAALAGVWSLGLAPSSVNDELPVRWAAPDFLLTDQSGQAFSSAELAGQVWVAGFIFTQCSDICPLITSRMALVRDSLAAEGLLGTSVRLVSFSVDPARDTPEVLADYARRFGASPSAEWAFLTGPDPESIRSMIQEGFHVTAVAAAGHGAHGYEVMHSPRVMIVDSEGAVRGHYDSREPEFVQLLLADLRTLLGSGARAAEDSDSAEFAVSDLRPSSWQIGAGREGSPRRPGTVVAPTVRASATHGQGRKEDDDSADPGDPRRTRAHPADPLVLLLE